MGQAAGDSSGLPAGLTKLRRRFVQLAEQSGDPASNLRVLQFNTLADGLAQNGDFIAVRGFPSARRHRPRPHHKLPSADSPAAWLLCRWSSIIQWTPSRCSQLSSRGQTPAIMALHIHPIPNCQQCRDRFLRRHWNGGTERHCCWRRSWRPMRTS